MRSHRPVRSLPPPRTRRKIALALLVACFALALGAGSWYAVAYGPVSVNVSSASLEALVKRWGPWGPFVSILLMVAHAFVPFPAEAVAVANGMLFGPWYGTLLTWSGAMTGAILSYGLARWLGRQAIRRLVSTRHWPAIERWSGKIGTGYWLLARLIPVISFNLINYAAGLANVRFWTFLWTTGVGILPLTIISVLLGDRLLEWPHYAWAAVAAAAIAAFWVGRVLGHRMRAYAAPGHRNDSAGR